MRIIVLVFFFSVVLSCKKKQDTALVNDASIESNEVVLTKEDSLKIKEHFKKAYNSGVFSQGYQKNLDSILQIKPDYAYLWQQKAMPCFKSKKYEIGTTFLDKAVALNLNDHIEYRAFIKCIFSKQYKDALVDFKKAKELFGYSHVMDHSYDFYMGLCHLQLNEMEQANAYLKSNIEHELKEFDEDWISSVDWFYLGISYFELEDYEAAVLNFDKALKGYPNFGDAQFYKAQSLIKLGEIDTVKTLFSQAYDNILNGNTINEANSIYEKYPYQVYEGQAKSYLR
jgi:tetratricopeptide (TPR) repeat protein